MISIKIPIELEQIGSGVKTSILGLENVEKQAKRTQAAVKDVGTGFASGSSRASEFADATGRVSTKLARSVETLGLSAAGFRQLDDVMDIAELGFNGMTKAAAGFNATSVGVAGAGLAIGMAFGSWLNTFPAVQKAADGLLHTLFRFVGLAPEIVASAGPISEFSKRIAAINADAMRKQVAQLRASGMKGEDIAKTYGNLSPELLKELGLTKEALKVENERLAVAKKHKEEIKQLIELMANPKVNFRDALTVNFKKDLVGSAMATSIDTSSLANRSATSSAQGADVLGGLMVGGIATSLNISYSLGQALDRTKKVANEAQRWQAALQGVALLAGAIGGRMGAAVNVIGNIGSSFQGFGKMSGTQKFNTIASGIGQIGGLIGAKAGGAVAGAAGGAMAGAALGGVIGGVVGGLVGGIAGWISAGKKAKEQMAEMKKQFIEGAGGMSALTMRAQEAGASLDKLFAAKDTKALEKAMLEVQKTIDAFESKMNGLKEARAAAESLMDRVAKGGFSEKFGEAVGVMVQKVQDALLKSGLGFMATGPLRDSEAFMGAQGAAGDVAQLLAGMRAGGAVDAGLLGAAGQSAVELQAQAVEAAKAAGLEGADATKAGFGAIAPLLREQLNSEIAANGKISSTLQAQLDEAKANGVTILADPMVESVAVEKAMLSELKRMNGGGGGPEAAFASGTRGLRTLKRDLVARIHEGEGLMVIPKDEMTSMSFRSFAKGTPRDDEDRIYGPRGRPDSAAGVGDMPSPVPTGGGGAPAPAVLEEIVGRAAARAAAAAGPRVTINSNPVLNIQDGSLARTVDSARALARAAEEAFSRALDQNSRGLRSQLEQLIDRRVAARAR